MVNESDDSNAYTDTTLTAIIEAYPLLDSDGNEPVRTDWTATYDLHAARGMCSMKGGCVRVDFDFSADGGNYSRSQVYQHCFKNICITPR